MSWSKIDTYFILFIICAAILFEIFFGEPAVGAEYRFTPPPPPDVVVGVEVMVNGIPIQFSNSKCPSVSSVMSVEAEPVDFTECPKGYKCAPNPSKGMRTLRVSEEARYKKVMKEWAEKKNSGVRGDK